MADAWFDVETNDSVATKRELWQPIADKIGGFDVDPASGAEDTPIAETCYTKEDNGLTKQWPGTVWLNPPFSDKETWFKRLYKQYAHGPTERVVALANAGTDTDWFQEWFSTADLVVFLDGRDWYTEDGTENFASMLGVWNPTEDLETYLQTLGTVVEPKEDSRQQTLV
jgi:hypothetical protein